jgi:hypothetical protein
MFYFSSLLFVYLFIFKNEKKMKIININVRQSEVLKTSHNTIPITLGHKLNMVSSNVVNKKKNK